MTLDGRETMSVAGKRRTEYADDAPRDGLAPVAAALSFGGQAPMTTPPHSVRCVCGHWDTEHAAFTRNIIPGRTRTFCDHCDCRSWTTPEDADLSRRDDRIDAGLGTGYIGEFR